MKVLVIGGTGAFGARLCELLARDGVAVTIASRRKPNPSFFPHLVFDRNGPLTGLDGFDVIVDAAGPFHAYGRDPYRVAKAAIATGAHYFDLCDNAAFCAGISCLDRLAKDADVGVYSGMSSTPAITSAAVEALCEGVKPLMIESAILPGNKAPRGRAVVESILDQAGRTYTEQQGGQDALVRSWSDPEPYDLGDFSRQGWRIEVPDQRLFPDHFNCPTVRFRAGLELGVMRYGLAAFSVLRGAFGFRLRDWMVNGMMLGAKALAPFGSDRGGMIVEVIAAHHDGFVIKRWIMRANSGDGPYTPAIAVRAACRDLGAIPPGAGPALSLVPLDAIEACFEDLDIETETQTRQVSPPFKTVLGATFDKLPKTVRATHDSVVPRTFRGRASVTRGRGLQARIAALVFGFPATTDDIEVEVTKTRYKNGEKWLRRFGRSTFKSFLRPTPNGMSERFGLLTFDLDLHVRDARLHFPVKGGRIGWIPLPRFLLPESIANEAEIDGVFHFDVLLKAPTGATLVHYKGWLRPDEKETV
ncbi:DUF4166 domain-containing protein [Octadecabacter sp. 1_MG-2023]|uniref:SDR family oxidoreductase n=1 Tax=unclassified Octadecabacter TaxID=196158 RepID=UPI001C0A2CC2|nr:MULTISPECIES: SDR family oxidoreductase [unclassified Octadecabacter]MBU2993980.1 DUF4166 domain-containing protein [Octadecabacter sp. B2R22]MDO6735173.1 DUF4166 domain-containing protein [Octadecabacter sp. 1_MG-2023]